MSSDLGINKVGAYHGSHSIFSGKRFDELKRARDLLQELSVLYAAASGGTTAANQLTTAERVQIRQQGDMLPVGTRLKPLGFRIAGSGDAFGMSLADYANREPIIPQGGPPVSVCGGKVDIIEAKVECTRPGDGTPRTFEGPHKSRLYVLNSPLHVHRVMPEEYIGYRDRMLLVTINDDVGDIVDLQPGVSVYLAPGNKHGGIGLMGNGRPSQATAIFNPGMEPKGGPDRDERIVADSAIQVGIEMIKQYLDQYGK